MSGFEIIVASQVKPTVYEIKGQFRREVPVMKPGVFGCPIRGNTDLAGHAQIRIAFEGDDISGGGVLQKISMNFGEGRIGENHNGKYPLGTTCQKTARVLVEGLDDTFYYFGIQTQPWVTIGNIDTADCFHSLLVGACSLSEG